NGKAETIMLRADLAGELASHIASHRLSGSDRVFGDLDADYENASAIPRFSRNPVCRRSRAARGFPLTPPYILHEHSASRRDATRVDGADAAQRAETQRPCLHRHE